MYATASTWKNTSAILVYDWRIRHSQSLHTNAYKILGRHLQSLKDCMRQRQRWSMSRWKTFGTEFWKFYCNGSFFQKHTKFLHNFNVLWLQAAITLQWLQIAGNSLPNDPSTRCLVFIFRSTLQSPPNKVSVKCPSVCTYVIPSTKFLQFQWNLACW